MTFGQSFQFRRSKPCVLHALYLLFFIWLAPCVCVYIRILCIREKKKPVWEVAGAAAIAFSASLSCCFSELSDVVAAVAGAAGSDAVMLDEDDDNMTSFDIHSRPTKNVTLEATIWPEEDGEKVAEVPFGRLETDWSRLMLLLQELRQPEGTTEGHHQIEQHLLRLTRLVIKAFQNLAADRDQSQTTPDAFENFTEIYAIEMSTEEEEEAATAATTLYTNDSVQYDEPLQTSTLTFNSSLHGNKSNMDQVENDEDSSNEYFFNLSFPNDEAKSDDNVSDVTEAKTSSDTTESSLKNLLSRLQRRNNTRSDREINAPEAEQELVSTSSSSSNDASSLLNVLNEDWSIDGFSARSKKEENLTQEILAEERNMGETTTTTTTTTTMALAETSTMIGLDSNATTTTMLPDNITSVAGENQTGAVARYEDDWKSPMPETTGSQEATTTTTMTTSGSSRRASSFTRRLVSSSPLVLLNKEDSDHQRKPRHEDASTTGSSGIRSGGSSSSSAANLQKSSSGKWSVLQEQ